MAHDKNAKVEVRRLYVFENLSLASCATAVDVSYATVQRWKRQAKDEGDDWDKLKSAHTLAGGSVEDVSRQILTGLMVAYQSTMEKLNDDETLSARDRVMLLASLADGYNKAVGANNKMMPETKELAVAMQVLQDFADFIQKHNADLLPAFVNVLEPFGEQLSKSFKSK